MPRPQTVEHDSDTLASGPPTCPHGEPARMVDGRWTCPLSGSALDDNRRAPFRRITAQIRHDLRNDVIEAAVMRAAKAWTDERLAELAAAAKFTEDERTAILEQLVDLGIRLDDDERRQYAEERIDVWGNYYQRTKGSRSL